MNRTAFSASEMLSAGASPVDASGLDSAPGDSMLSSDDVSAAAGELEAAGVAKATTGAAMVAAGVGEVLTVAT